ncbi:hypothetical protein BS47DRAFT_680246 [Hydnum rufescens UP504]|uniref:DUF202 domain-containing protein n=1 Tax=Hydnum rufescens UP504 TaxID=1448309 RepID=A0A9P6B2B0_9AGAM|nr:hypothetical protein BS47DRAFT_680246 [Hydnum rufescens UP504]
MSRDNTGASSREQPCLVGVQNVGSTARDVCAIERNFLSHARLALLLSLLSSAVLSDSALFFRNGSADPPKSISLASLCFVAALAVVNRNGMVRI